MAKPINMPQVGQDLETAIITEWCVAVNDTVKKGDIIAIVESDKATIEVESFESGTILKLLYKEGDEGKVLQPMAIVGEPGDKIEEEADKTPASAPAAVVAEEKEKQKDLPQAKGGKIFSSPVARRLAKEHGIDLSAIVGSGPKGRIDRDDVKKAIEAKSSNSGDVVAALENDQVIPFSKMRKIIAARLIASKQEIPHFYLSMDVDVSDLLAWRKEKNNNATPEQKITVNDILVAAVAKALRKYPNMNVHVGADQLTVKADVHVGIAVSVADGLLVPVVEHVDKKSIEEIGKISREIAQGARKGVLKPQAAGTFTISNLGMFAIDSFIPIINPPEGAILGVGRSTKKVVPVNDNTMGIRDIMTMTLACDHRAVDGALGAQFLEAIQSSLEQIKINNGSM